MKSKTLYLLLHVFTAFFVVVSIELVAIKVAHADPLAGLTIEPEYHGNDYRRYMFRHWTDEDGDGQDARQEVLIDESLAPVNLSADGRSVETGLWRCPLTGRMFTSPKNPANGYAWVQIDHVVPLKEAFQSGAQNWDADRRRAYANDRSNPGHLMAVFGPENARKGADDPAGYMPRLDNFRCAYALTWIGIKREWDLSVDDDEAQALRTILAGCRVD